ncbi:hypothetical protein H6P81_002460 [Aristolochia fimbriata]|uniref:RNA helicase n=1 Tax=Aristolochia fimbriata TaxID=158543 RepID=A0AAV7FDX6_ARIFI|nr:hypothetical protein H6P81_002460 [Aristolochia fimbriata]
MSKTERAKRGQLSAFSSSSLVAQISARPPEGGASFSSPRSIAFPKDAVARLSRLQIGMLAKGRKVGVRGEEMAAHYAFGPEDDIIIKHRLLTRTTTTRGEPPLKKLQKKFTAFVLEVDKDADNFSDCERLYKAFLQEMATFELPLLKSKAVVDANLREKESFNELQQQIQSQILQSQADIEDLKRQLEDSKIERLHKEECEAIRRLIALQPPRSETQKIISDLEAEIASLEAENVATSRTLELRKKQFSLLLHVVDELQNNIEDEQKSLAEELRLALDEQKINFLEEANGAPVAVPMADDSEQIAKYFNLGLIRPNAGPNIRTPATAGAALPARIRVKSKQSTVRSRKFSVSALQLEMVCFSLTRYHSIARASVSLPENSSNGYAGVVSIATSNWKRFRGLSCFAALANTQEIAPTLRELCGNRVPEHVLKRAEEVGFSKPTDVQRQALPILLAGQDCIIHAQTGSGKTLAYLLLIFSAIDSRKSAVQALIVVPTRELGMQVAKVARMVAAKPVEYDQEQKICTVMTILDGGMLKRHKSWLKAEPPQIVVATISSLCQMLERQIFKLDKLRVLVIDEVDFMFNSSKQVYSLRKVLTSYSTISNRQTVFASASIPQHNRFVHDCIQQKWTKSDVAHVHVNPVEPMPSRLFHKFVVCSRREKLPILLSLLQIDQPKSGIIFVNEQSEKSKKAGNPPMTTSVIEFLKTSYHENAEILLLEEEMNFNARAASLTEVRQGGCILVATDIAGRGVDLPETTHIYNFNLPKTAINYLHRAGRTGRRPFSDEKCSVTTFITPEERFVLRRFENELMFQSEEISLN